MQKGKSFIMLTSQSGMRKKTKDTKKLRKDSCWFQFWETAFAFGSTLFLIPYKLTFVETEEIYKITSSTFHKAIWLIMQTSGILVMRVRILEGWDYVKGSDEQLRYFDFGFLIVVYCFDLTFKLVLWGKRNDLNAFLEELQHTPLIAFTSPRSIKISIFLVAFCISYLIPSFFYFCLTWGIHSFDYQLFYDAVQSQALATFNLDPAWSSSPFFGILMIISFTINQYQASFWHFNDIYVLSSIFLMHRVAQDFQRALKTQDLFGPDVIHLIKRYKELILGYNHALGIATCVYSLYCTPYYAMHLVDMLDLPDFLNRFSMSVYLGFLALGLAAATEMNTMAKEMKRWLEAEERYLKKIHITGLSFLMDDLSNKKFGLGTFFVIHHGLAGQIVNLILTLAIITIQMKLKAAKAAA